MYYIPDFITLDEEKRIIEQVNSAPKPKWTQLSHRRLQNWGGIPHPKGMIAEKLPEVMHSFLDVNCRDYVKINRRNFHF